MSPTLNPLYNQSSSVLEDDYVLIERVYPWKDPKSLKDKLVSLKNPYNSKERIIRRVKCVEAE